MLSKQLGRVLLVSGMSGNGYRTWRCRNYRKNATEEKETCPAIIQFRGRPHSDVYVVTKVQPEHAKHCTQLTATRLEAEAKEAHDNKLTIPKRRRLKGTTHYVSSTSPSDS